MQCASSAGLCARWRETQSEKTRDGVTKIDRVWCEESMLTAQLDRALIGIVGQSCLPVKPLFVFQFVSLISKIYNSTGCGKLFNSSIFKSDMKYCMIEPKTTNNRDIQFMEANCDGKQIAHSKKNKIFLPLTSTECMSLLCLPALLYIVDKPLAQAAPPAMPFPS